MLLMGSLSCLMNHVVVTAVARCTSFSQTTLVAAVTAVVGFVIFYSIVWKDVEAAVALLVS